MARKRKTGTEIPEGPENDETFAFIAGYTSGGLPYGVTWAEAEQAAVKDRFGNIWNLATHVEDVSAEEMQRRMAARFGQ